MWHTDFSAIPQIIRRLVFVEFFEFEYQLVLIFIFIFPTPFFLFFRSTDAVFFSDQFVVVTEVPNELTDKLAVHWTATLAQVVVVCVPRIAFGRDQWFSIIFGRCAATRLPESGWSWWLSRQCTCRGVRAKRCCCRAPTVHWHGFCWRV